VAAAEEEDDDEEEADGLHLWKRGGPCPTVSSQFKGVSWHKSRKKWVSRSTEGNHLGCHATEQDAAQAVDNYAKHGMVPESTR
jgi:hypothetical protein